MAKNRDFQVEVITLHPLMRVRDCSAVKTTRCSYSYRARIMGVRKARLTIYALVYDSGRKKVSVVRINWCPH